MTDAINIERTMVAADYYATYFDAPEAPGESDMQNRAAVAAAVRQDCADAAERYAEPLAEALRDVWALYEPDPGDDGADTDNSYAACIEHEESGGVKLEMPYVTIRTVRDALAEHDRQAAP